MNETQKTISTEAVEMRGNDPISIHFRGGLSKEELPPYASASPAEVSGSDKSETRKLELAQKLHAIRKQQTALKKEADEIRDQILDLFECRTGEYQVEGFGLMEIVDGVAEYVNPRKLRAMDAQLYLRLVQRTEFQRIRLEVKP